MGRGGKGDDDVTDQAATLQRLVDESDIRRMAAFYTDALNHRDPVRATSVYADDAVLIGQGLRHEGRETICKRLTYLMDMYSLIHQVAHSPLIEINGDTAKTRTSLYEIGVQKDTQEMTVFLAEMEDEWVRLPVGWRFSQRTLHMTGRGVINLDKFQEVASVPLTLGFDLIKG
jgi:ketosteroid isomerase-like protein